MHKPIQDGLEEYLSGKADGGRLEAFHRHLAGCDDCRRELTALESHAQLLRGLRPRTSYDPAPGFYARVIDRIEAQGADSFWSIFMEPAFGKRLVLASLALLALLGSAIFTAPVPDDPSSPVGIMATFEYPPAPGVDQQHDRSLVLVNLATYSQGSAAPLRVASE